MDPDVGTSWVWKDRSLQSTRDWGPGTLRARLCLYQGPSPRSVWMFGRALLRYWLVLSLFFTPSFPNLPPLTTPRPVTPTSNTEG